MPPPPERRDHARVKVKVPVELHFEDNDTPYRVATSDLSLLGCYIETMFPFPVGTHLELKLQANTLLLILGTIVTSDPQVGNGIQFTKMLPEDVEELRAFLEAVEKEQAETAAAEKEASEKKDAEKKGAEKKGAEKGD
jgi:PilZ domain